MAVSQLMLFNVIAYSHRGYIGSILFPLLVVPLVLLDVLSLYCSKVDF